MFSALGAMRDVDNYATIQGMQLFLWVAANPEISMGELEEPVGISQASVSRGLAALSKINRNKQPGSDLIKAVEDIHNRRRKLCVLTSKGEALLQKLHSIYEDNSLEQVELKAVSGALASRESELTRKCEELKKEVGALKEQLRQAKVEKTHPERPVKKFCSYCGERL